MEAINQILFEDYLQSRLTHEALEKFTARLSQDSHFRKEFELYKELDYFIQERTDNIRALSAIEKISNEVRESPKDGIKSGSSLKWLLFVILLGMAALMITKMQGSSESRHNELMAMYKPPLPSSNTRSGDIPTATLEQAIYYFDLRRWKDSKDLFTTILAKNPDNQVCNRYMAHISFVEKNYKDSKRYLKDIKQPSHEDNMLLDLVNKGMSK